MITLDLREKKQCDAVPALKALRLEYCIFLKTDIRQGTIGVLGRYIYPR